MNRNSNNRFASASDCRQPRRSSGAQVSARTARKQRATDVNRQPLSRGTAEGRYAAARKNEKSKKIKRGVLVGVLTVLFAVIAGAAWYLGDISSRLNAGIDSALQGKLAATGNGEPFYMLLLGTDRNKERENSAQYGKSDHNYRSDSIILTRIDPKNHKVTLVSIHRDTIVNLGEHGKQKINAAYAFGGPAYMTEVVSKFAGVPISHYAEVNMDGLLSIIDKLGGVEVNVPRAIHDPQAGGDVEAGQQVINGKQAIILCRARHAYDDCGDGDAFRAANQRMIISAIIKKILTSNPATMAATISDCTNYVTTDMDIATILSLANQMKGIDTSKDIYSGMEPTTSKYINHTWYEVCNVPAWKAMMKRVNDGLPPYENKSDDPTRGIAGSVDGTDGKSDKAAA